LKLRYIWFLKECERLKQKLQEVLQVFQLLMEFLLILIHLVQLQKLLVEELAEFMMVEVE
jgi:hypothetical protein